MHEASIDDLLLPQGGTRLEPRESEANPGALSQKDKKSPERAQDVFEINPRRIAHRM